jgi:signal transduction histidine kinase
VISTFHAVPLGMFTFVLLQSIILSKRFAKAFERVQIAEREIRALNDDLEQKVLERTQTIRTILDNVRSGFLMIDANLTIMNGFTKSCYELLGPHMKPGCKLSEFFHFSERDKVLFELSLGQVFDDLMPEDVSLGQIPDRLQQGQKSFSLQGSVVRPGLGRAPVALLLTISDATQLVKAEAEASQNKSLLKIISEKVSFRAFVKDSLQSLEACLQLIAKRNYREVALILHTLKGNFALYGLESISALIHEIEEKSQPESIDICAIMQNVEEFVNLNASLLGFQASDLEAHSYEIDYLSLQNLEHDLLRANLSCQQLQIFNRWMREIRMVPIRELLGPIEANVQRLARALGKSVTFHMEGAELRVDSDRMRPPLKSLIHALINSIDHGIEYPEEREGKDEVGRVFLCFRYDDMRNLCIEVGDDGRGLDLNLIRSKALKAGLVTNLELERMQPNDLRRLIFHQGFSTKNNVSEYSGRGVGIAALDFAVRSLGGEIEIQSEPGEGTQFLIVIPTDQTIEILSGTA